MANISDYIDFSASPSTIISLLKEKEVSVPKWSVLKKDYNYKEHSILRDKVNLRDKIREDGTIEKSSRLSLALEMLLVRRMSEFMFSIPVRRVYSNTDNNETRKHIANAIEAIYKQARINSHNLLRSKDYFACCEIFTLWYAVKSENTLYGFKSKYKIKCKTFSPKDNVSLYPVFDDTGDMIAMSIEYTVTRKRKSKTYFETYTENTHYKWVQSDSIWEIASEPEEIAILKIPGVYLSRSEAIYDVVSEIRKEIEYTLSRNSNVISYNAAPILKVIGNLIGAERKGEDQRLFRIEQGGDVGYVAWAQAINAISYQVEKLLDFFWSLTQMPDISFVKMQKLGNIGYDARETLLTDAHLKVGDESGEWIEAFEREGNVIKAFLKMMNTEWADEVDNVGIEYIITPFIQRNEATEISKRMTANGGKPVESQLESIKRLGQSADPDATLEQIRKEDMETSMSAINDVFK